MILLALPCLFFFISSFPPARSSFSGCHVHVQAYVATARYYTSCWDLWKWWSCTQYKKVTLYKYTCDTGWTDIPCCSDPLCGGVSGQLACNISYAGIDKITFFNGSIGTISGGICSSPDNCTNCNDGFYSTGPHCEICPSIPNCHQRRCSSTLDNSCIWCYYENVLGKRYDRAYKYDPEVKQCRKTCSWRPDSTRCFPGYCPTEFTESCNCTAGFSGTHCDTITQPVEILEARSTFTDPENNVAESPKDINKPKAAPKYWTNNVDWKQLEISFLATYNPLDNVPKFGYHDAQNDSNGFDKYSHYVTEFKYGIIRGELKAHHIRDNNRKSLFNSDPINCNSSCNLLYPCPVNQPYSCTSNGKIDITKIWGRFQHNDEVHISLELENGGYLKFENRDNKKTPVKTTTYLRGVTTSETYKFHWDREKPYYQCNGSNCSPIPLNVADTTKTNVINVFWDEWCDSLAGIDFYELEVFELQGVETLDQLPIKTANMTNIRGNGKLSETFNVTKPGMYSIILHAFDKADNHKTSRALFIFDNLSEVEIYNGTITVDGEAQYLEKTWITFPERVLHFKWTDRFINVRHVQNHWLNSVKQRGDVESHYDDNTGVRTTHAVPNVRGITTFEVAYFVYGQTLKSFLDYLPITNVIDESVSTAVSWDDGDMANFSIRAFDILGDYLEDNITIFRDASPPVISNLWLTRGNRVNISVHNIEEFTHITIEWDAFDYHSGVSHLKWRLYDNFTGSDVDHGEENMHGQGNTQTLTECEKMYGDSPKGPSCYCTMYTGCYHKHFYVQPKINAGNGLRPDKYKGIHDYDYYIEVQVTNMAELEVVETVKITIDVSPPVAGYVQDGVPGSPEVDYQQNLHLNAHWNGFVDHESGVQFYQYEFSTSCLSREFFLNKSIKEDTYETTASFYAPAEGTYYITVVAYNRANEMSEPVCSDGVTVSTEVPTVKNVAVSNAKTHPRLFIDGNNNVWFLDDSIRRHKVANVTNYCRYSNILHENADIFPENLMTVDESTICNSSTQYNGRLTRILPKVLQLNITWNPGTYRGLINDFEVGLSSTTDSPYPDIMTFKSSKHQTHILINHFGIPEGNLFYVIMRSISKSNVVGTQTLGPYIMDTTPPAFVGDHIDIHLYDMIMVANWSKGDFRDMEDPYPLLFEYAIGHNEYRTDVQEYLPVRETPKCKFDIIPTCVSVNASQLKWQLHEHHQYFITIKATNLAGLSVVRTSLPYIFDTQLATVGIVIDVPLNSTPTVPLKDIEDIDYTDQTESLAVRWYNFYHPHLKLTYYGCVGTKSGKCDVHLKTKIEDGSYQHVFQSLKLDAFKMYFVTIIAETSTGSVNTSDDGIYVVNSSIPLSQVQILDGKNCSENFDLQSSHHYKDPRPACKTDLDFQTSVTSLNAYWEMPTKYLEFITHGFWTVEERHWFGDFWNVLNSLETQYIEIHRKVTLSVTELSLTPGRMYRILIQFCADDICFPVLISNGVTVTPNKPVSSALNVRYIEETTDKVILDMANMYDPDIQDEEEARNAIDYYEYTIMDEIDGSYHSWLPMENITSLNSSHSQITINFDGRLDFSKCKKLAVRGYNKAGVCQTSMNEIKKCGVNGDNQMIVPRIIIDAIGEQEINQDGSAKEAYGKEIYLEENGRWSATDVDYTPYKNVLSATWDSLRHKDYTFAVIEIESLDSLSYYQRVIDLHLPDPCSHPDAIRCGHTVNEYVNIIFSSEYFLQHSKRYAICIHAPFKLVSYEKWSEELQEINECSDGIVVDLTPPIPGRVWIGWNPTEYVTSTSDLYVTWDSFIDIEESGITSHSSGIKGYYVAIGSVPGGSDLTEYTNVGLVNHVTFPKLALQNGHMYYASVKGVDFTNRSSVAISAAVMVDHTPPEQTSKSITITGRHITNASQINACWRDVFLDHESGIKHYIWAIGSKTKFDDIKEYTETNEDCVLAVENADLQNGHAYFITIKAVNKAGLYTTASSSGFIYDTSPPEAGHVYDGFLEISSSNQRDIDFQTDTSNLGAFWEGFYDPHLPIKYFTIGIGTCAGWDDILQTHEIGSIYNYTLNNIGLAIGVRYFTTVTACNAAELCTSVTSDGLVIDNSPPTVGLVKDGTEYEDINYQPLINFIAASWQGFNDPQSGLEKFVVWAGKIISGDDILSQMDVQMSTKFVLSNLKKDLPTNTRIYFTVRAFNKAGLYSEATTNGVLVDISPPVIFQQLKLDNSLGSVVENTLVYRSCLKVTWKVKDDESFIERQYLSLTSHKGGEVNTTAIQIPGIVREYTFAGLDLHDGGKYFVKLISCNGAHLCVEDESDGFIVDNSPPVAGMFAIRTDHAANLNRHVPGWMTWSKYKLWLSWLGFSDVHSGIDFYVVSVGSSFMMHDLNKDGIPKTIFHNDSQFDRHDEGTVQTFELETSRLSDFEHVFISLWAVNKVGIKCDMVHNQFSLVSGGSLELVRRCSFETCLGHCVCSARNKQCPVVRSACFDITNNNTNTLISVHDVTSFKENSWIDATFTPSNELLAAKWRLVHIQGLLPKWYEWSVGDSNSDEPEGIIDRSLEPLWHACGQMDNAVYSLRRGKKLTQSASYSFFVRVWYNSYTFADFKSNGVVVMSKPLTITKSKGAAVTETFPGHWMKDIDYMPIGGLFSISWSNVFQKADIIIAKFNVYISTFPKGYDSHAIDIDLPGSAVSVNISRLPLTPGVLYYSNVVGYSYAGQYSSVSSDGFTVDDDRPIVGVVMDGVGKIEMDYQNSSRVVAASWYGFADLNSGIASYFWCVQSKESDVDCDILPFENVGIQRIVSRTLNSTVIPQGTMIINKVYAVDFVGHSSYIAVSDGVVVDTTAPEPVQMTHVDLNILSNPSFEESTTHFVELFNKTLNNDICGQSLPQKWKYSEQDCVCVLGSAKTMAIDGRSFLLVRGHVFQTVDGLQPDSLYRITFFVAHSPFEQSLISSKEGFIKFGNGKHIFLIYSKAKNNGNGVNITWHPQTFYFTVRRESVDITFGSIGMDGGILIDNIRISKALKSETDTKHHVLSHSVWVNDWHSIHASWMFTDKESPVVKYLWAIGYKESSTEIQGYTSVGLNNFAYNYNVTLLHTSQVHVTVVAVNAAGLSRKATAEALYIDLTPPKIDYVYDGIGFDIDSQATDEISANWRVSDKESGLSFCEWAIGYSQLGNELQVFTRVNPEVKTVSVLFARHLILSKTIFVTMRCHNNAGLHSIMSSDGVTISDIPPLTDDVIVNIMGQSDTPYPNSNNFFEDSSSFRVKWTGFVDNTAIDSYFVNIRDGNKKSQLSQSILSEQNGVMYCSIWGLNFSNGMYYTGISAVNSAFLRSETVSTNITISSSSPAKSEKGHVRCTEQNRNITISWDGVFTSEHPLYYEVSVGTSASGADIIQWLETTNTYIEIYVPTRVKLYKGVTVYVTITAVGQNGKYVTKRDTFEL